MLTKNKGACDSDRFHPEGDRLLSLDEAPLPFIVASGVFCGLLIVCAAVGSKVINVFGITPGASVLAFSVSFVCTDLISELYGKARAKQVVMAGLVTIVVGFALFQLAVRWPAAPFWENESAYNSVLGTGTRIFLVGILSYLASQLHDVFAFHFWRRITKGKHLWLRNNLSTMTSQLINSAIFVPLVFWGTVPMLKVIFSHYIIKLAIAVADTGIVYLLIIWLRRLYGLNQSSSAKQLSDISHS